LIELEDEDKYDDDDDGDVAAATAGREVLFNIWKESLFAVTLADQMRIDL
jgi:hypothetical protein